MAISSTNDTTDPAIGEFPETFAPIRGGRVRLLWRAMLLALLTALTVLAIFTGLMTAIVYRPLAVRVRQAAMHYWSRVAFRIAGIHVRTKGTPPSPPFLLVANHLSYLDIFLIGHAVGSVNIAKADVKGWGIFGFLASIQGTIYIERELRRDTRRVNERIVKALDDGYGVNIFAESRIGPGKDVARFKSSLLQPAAEEGIAVHYATISYSVPNGPLTASEVIVWPRGVSFVQHMIRLLRVPRIDASITFGRDPISGSDRKELADRLWTAVRENFVPLE